MCKSKDENEVYQELIKLGKSGKPSVFLISNVAQYLDYSSNKVKAKVLWMLGELGSKNSQKIASYVKK